MRTSFLSARWRAMSGPWALLCAAVTFVYIFSLGPILITAAVSFNATNRSFFPPRGFSLRWWERTLAPLLASVVVRTYGWYIILNRFGFANDVLLGLGVIADRIAFMPSTGAIIVGLAHALLPYTVLTIMGSVNGINPNLESAAMSLGANRTRTFFNVVLPLSLPGIAGGFILVFSIAISAYATPAILGGPATQVAATAIYTFIIQLLDWSLGAALAVILIVCSLLLLYAAARFGARQATL